MGSGSFHLRFCNKPLGFRFVAYYKCFDFAGAGAFRAVGNSFLCLCRLSVVQFPADARCFRLVFRLRLCRAPHLCGSCSLCFSQLARRAPPPRRPPSRRMITALSSAWSFVGHGKTFLPCSPCAFFRGLLGRANEQPMNHGVHYAQ